LSLASSVTSSSNLEPLSFKKAYQLMCWHNAMQFEIASLHANGTWSLVTFYPTMNVVGCQWMYKIKWW
jgi:histone deacetylase 1/2